MQPFGSKLSSKQMIFTPSTPYVHKFRTEMCKNFEVNQCQARQLGRKFKYIVVSFFTEMENNDICTYGVTAGYGPLGRAIVSGSIMRIAPFPAEPTWPRGRRLMPKGMSPVLFPVTKHAPRPETPTADPRASKPAVTP